MFIYQIYKFTILTSLSLSFCVCMSVGMYVPVSIHANQCRMTHSLALRLQVAQSHLMWVLETDLESSVKQYIALFKITYQIPLKLKLQVVASHIHRC